MNVGVLGAGALGTLFGASLARVRDVRVLVHRAETARAIMRRGGLVVEGEPPRAVPVSTESDTFADVDLVVVAVKAFATVEALRPLRDVVDDHVPIISIQNGIDAADQIVAALGDGRRIALAPTTEAGTLLDPGVVRRVAPGTTYLGWAHGHGEDAAGLAALVSPFRDAGLDVRAVADVAPYLWAKLVVNAALSPVAALAGVPNGAVLADPNVRARADAIAGEVAAVARAERVALPFDDPVAAYESVARATAANRSSMLQDFDAGRRTEVDAILGAVVRRAAAHAVPVPVTTATYDEVRRRESA